MKRLNRFEFRDLGRKRLVVNTGIFNIQFDSCDIILKSKMRMAFDLVCLLNLSGNFSCRVQLLTVFDSGFFEVFAVTQSKAEEQHWDR